MKKLLAFVIIFLFIGSNVVSGLNNQLKNTNIPLITGRGYIQGLIDSASNGDIIYIPSGIYYENIIIDKSISLVGEDKNNTIIDGSYSGIVVSIVSDWVNIREFTIRNSGMMDKSGIKIFSNHTIIMDNIISNNDDGIHLDDYSDNNNITGNNIISNKGDGIFLDYYSYNNIIIGNNISNNYYGIFFRLYSGKNIIIDNNINSNNYDGIRLFSSSGNIITGNNISNNEDGIYLIYSSNNNIITGNNISNNKDGMYFWDSIFNRILKNNFLGNERDAFFSNEKTYLSALKINRWNQNYWEQPRTLPKPIFGEIYWFLGYPYWERYHIPWIPQFDWHPAKEPYDIGV
jgi:parallel beta-helix repeat protein